MSTIVTDTETIGRLVQEAVSKAVADSLPRLVREATQKQWLTKEELKALTGWSDRTVQHLRDTRQIPFAQHGRKIVYPSRGIEEFLERNGVRTRQSPPRHQQREVGR